MFFFALLLQFLRLVLLSCMATLNGVEWTTYDFTFRPNYVTTLAIRLSQVSKGELAIPDYEFELQESIMWSV